METLFILYFIGGLFVAFKAIQYAQKRQIGHDNYPVGIDASGKCPNMDMFGFKFSAILCFTILNFLTLLVLIADRKKETQNI